MRERGWEERGPKARLILVPLSGLKAMPFRFLLLKSVVLDRFMVSSGLLSVDVHLPQFVSQCKEQRDDCKNQK